MIDVSELIDDPDFATTFQVRRRTGSFANEGAYSTTETTLTKTGVIQPASQDDRVAYLPEGERTLDAIRIWCRDEIQMADGKGKQSDVVVWNGQHHRVAGPVARVGRGLDAAGEVDARHVRVAADEAGARAEAEAVLVVDGRIVDRDRHLAVGEIGELYLPQAGAGSPFGVLLDHDRVEAHPVPRIVRPGSVGRDRGLVKPENRPTGRDRRCDPGDTLHRLRCAAPRHAEWEMGTRAQLAQLGQLIDLFRQVVERPSDLNNA